MVHETRFERGGGMNNRHRRVKRLRRKYETPGERWSREIIQAFLKFGQKASEAAKKLEKAKFR